MQTRPIRSAGKGWLFGILLAGLLIACSEGEPEESGESGRDGVIVELAEVERRDVELRVRGIGTLQAAEQVTLRPELAGRVLALHFTEGGRVEAGQLLVELEAERVEQELAARQAELRALIPELRDARRTFERQQELRARDLVSQGELDRAETDYERATAERERLEAELARAVRNVADSRIRAPFDGVISEQEVDPGSYVAVGEALATVYRTDPIDVRFSVPERYLPRLALDQTVQLQLAAADDSGDAEPFTGSLIYISPAVDDRTRAVTVRARIPNEDGLLRPGLFATAFVVMETREGQLTIPDDAVVATRHGYIVYVVDDEQRAARREVSLGIRQDDWVEITDGLEAGERIVWRGHMRVDDGTRVQTESGDES